MWYLSLEISKSKLFMFCEHIDLKCSTDINSSSFLFWNGDDCCFCLFSAPAKILLITPNNTYVRGSRVELVCSVEGDPPPYVAWINVTDGSVLQNRTVNTSYVIPSVSSLHKGTCICVTQNIHGKDSRETTILDVFGKFDGNFLQCQLH